MQRQWGSSASWSAGIGSPSFQVLESEAFAGAAGAVPGLLSAVLNRRNAALSEQLARAADATAAARREAAEAHAGAGAAKAEARQAADLQRRLDEAMGLLQEALNQFDNLPHLGPIEGPVAFSANKIRAFLAAQRKGEK